MPDRPDLSKYLPGSERHSLEDLSELAARLGSPVTYDRRGEVVWMDQFNTGMSRWKDGSYDADDKAELTADYPYQGNYAVKLITGGAAVRMAEIHRYLSPPHVNKWGLEVAVNFWTDFNSFAIELRRIHGELAYSASLRINNVDGKIQVYDGDNELYELDDLPLSWGGHGHYHVLKIVADFSTNYRVRALFDQNEYDITTLAIKPVGTDEAYYNDVMISFIGREGETDYCIIGQVIVTANEP